MYKINVKYNYCQQNLEGILFLINTTNWLLTLFNDPSCLDGLFGDSVE